MYFAVAAIKGRFETRARSPRWKTETRGIAVVARCLDTQWRNANFLNVQFAHRTISRRKFSPTKIYLALILLIYQKHLRFNRRTISQSHNIWGVFLPSFLPSFRSMNSIVLFSAINFAGRNTASIIQQKQKEKYRDNGRLLVFILCRSASKITSNISDEPCRQHAFRLFKHRNWISPASKVR